MLDVNNSATFTKVIGWTLFWFTLYKSSFKIFRKKEHEFNCRVITLVHAIVVTVTSCYITFFNGTNPFTVIGLPNTHPQHLIMTASLGYFLFDFAWCMYYQTEGLVMLLHHVVSITFISACLYLGVSGTEVVATIFGSEVTSIVLNIRWFMKHFQLYHDVLGLSIDALFFGLFLCVRLGVGGYLTYRVLESERPPPLIKAGGSLFYAVNHLFFIQIVQFFKYRVSKWKKQENISNNSKSSSGNGTVDQRHSNGHAIEHEKSQ